MDKIMFIGDVADRLRRTPAQLRLMVHMGTAPQSAIIAGRRCWRESDVEKYIADAFSSAQ